MFFETWDEHLKKHGKKHRCARCVWQRSRQKWECALVYTTKHGLMEPWVEEICDPQRPWGLGCKLCRLAGIDNAYARGEIRGKNRIHFPGLQRHGGRVGTPLGKRPAHCRAHMRAQEKVLQMVEGEDPDRRDVPNRGLCMTAYKIAKAGASFQSYEVDVQTSRACGGRLPNSRRSRKTAKTPSRQVKRARHEALQEARPHQRNVVAREGRNFFGLTPAKLDRLRALQMQERTQGLGDAPLDPNSREVIVLVERLLSFKRGRALDSTVDVADNLVATLRGLVGDDA